MTQRQAELVWAQDEFAAEEHVRPMLEGAPGAAEVIALACEPGDVPGLEQALREPSLFASDRFVVVRGAERLSAGGVARLAELVAGCAVTGLAIVAVADRPPAGLIKALEPVSRVVKLPKPRRGELVGWVAKRMRAAGLKPSGEAAAALVDAVGTGMRDLAQAVDQLRSRAGRGRAIERADILAHFPRTAEQPVWALFDALIAGDGPRAFRVLQALRAQGDDAMAVLFAVVSQVRHVMRARSALERSPGLSDSQLAQVLGVSVGRAAVLRGQAGRLGWDWLLRVHRACAEADIELKGGDDVRAPGVLPPEIVLERLVHQALPR